MKEKIIHYQKKNQNETPSPSFFGIGGGLLTPDASFSFKNLLSSEDFFFFLNQGICIAPKVLNKYYLKMTLKLYRYKIFSINNIIKGAIRSRPIKGYCTHVCMLAQPLSHVHLFVTSWTVAHQAPLSMEFSRQEYWSRFPFPSPGDVPNTRLNPYLLHWQLGSVLLSHKGSPPQTYDLLNLSSASNFTKVKGSSLFFFL